MRRIALVFLFGLMFCGQTLAQNPYAGSFGGSSSLVIGTTPITGGADTQVLFNNAGVVSSDAGLTKVAGATGAVTIGGMLNQAAGTACTTGNLGINFGSNTGFFATVGASVVGCVNGQTRATLSPTTLQLLTANGIDFAGGPGPFLQYGGSNGLLQQGVNAAAPQAQLYQGANARAGTDTNAAGGNFTLRPGAGTGTGTPSQLIFQNPAVTGSGSGAQTQTTAMTISGAQLVSLPAIITDSGQTATATVCEDTTTHALYFGSGTGGICKGTSARRYKRDIRDISDLGLASVIALQPKRYYNREGMGLDSIREQVGLIADEVRANMPDCADENSVDYLCVSVVSVNAIKALAAELEDLKKAIGR